MLTQNQIKEIREHLESSQNPLFFFDNDLDGLASFLLLRRFLNRGKGVAIKSFPALDETYIRKIKELNPDKIFILDKALVSEGFIEYCDQQGLDIVWIDHHGPEKPKGVFYYNPLSGKNPSSEPTSYLCWKVVQRDDWVALLGCLYDWFLPDFAKEFAEKYPGLLDESDDATKAKYETEMGKLTLILTFALKDTTTNVLKMMKVLIDTQTPYEIFSGDKKYEYIMSRYRKINRTYSKLLEKASRQKNEKIVFFQYGGDMGMTRELCNALVYKNPNKIVIVARVIGGRVNMSLTSPKKNLKPILEKALKEIEGTGGGHPRACGASIQIKDLERFKEIIEENA